MQDGSKSVRHAVTYPEWKGASRLDPSIDQDKTAMPTHTTATHTLETRFAPERRNGAKGNTPRRPIPEFRTENVKRPCPNNTDVAVIWTDFHSFVLLHLLGIP